MRLDLHYRQTLMHPKQNLYNISNSFVQVQVPSLIFYCQHWANPCIYDFLFTALLSAPALVVLLDFSNPLTGELSTRALALSYLANWFANPLLLSRMSATFDRHLELGTSALSDILSSGVVGGANRAFSLSHRHITPDPTWLLGLWQGHRGGHKMALHV